MSKSDAGKGDTYRPVNKELYDKNYDRIFEFNDNSKFFKNNFESIPNLQAKAKKIVKSKTSIWKKEIKNLNDKIFIIERDKKKKIYAYNRRVLNLKLESLKQRLERNISKKPTRRQIQNINRIEDETKKQERFQAVKKLEEELRFNDRDIKLVEKKLDNLSFEYEDLKNEMKRRNLAKFYTNLLSLAIIRVVD